MLRAMEITTVPAPTMPASLAGLVERLDTMRLTGRRETGSEAAALSTARYTDMQIWAREQATLFGHWPVVAAHSSELPVGSAMPFDALGVPIVLTRASDGRVRAFFNACRHRGMALVSC